MRGSIVVDGQRFALNMESATRIEVNTGKTHIELPGLPGRYWYRNTLVMQEDGSWAWNDDRVYNQRNTLAPEAVAAMQELAERAAWTWVAKKDALRAMARDTVADLRATLQAQRGRHAQAVAAETDAERTLWAAHQELTAQIEELQRQRRRLEEQQQELTAKRRHISIHVRNASTRETLGKEIARNETLQATLEAMLDDPRGFMPQPAQRSLPQTPVAQPVAMPDAGVGLDDLDDLD